MRSKQHIVAQAHENPEYAAMPAKHLAPIINVDQTTISKWRRHMKEIVSAPKRGRTLQPKVTVESVRRKWEEKYAALNKQYEYLAERLIDMAKNADTHRNAEKRLNKALDVANETIVQLKEEIRNLTEKKSWIQRLFSSKE